ncbi:MAG: class I SAM-dependent rRNA methyltransferase [Deltaproteobacteria bacterium]|nr:class I SAM-dependent rRNA methyltransferase [Deltaproteobacteria bacterium]
MSDSKPMDALVLKDGRERSLLRGHPWVMSGSVDEKASKGNPAAGDLVQVFSADGKPLGAGHYSPSSQIRLRLLSYAGEEPREGRLEELMALALARRNSPLLKSQTALRLINAEGDGLPGLVVDRFGDVVVVKLASIGMSQRRERIAQWLEKNTGASCGYERADSMAARREGMKARDGVLWGELPAMPISIEENGRRYQVDVVNGQKTGFFLDQRDARSLVQALAHGQRVLDLYAYTGGFGVAALCGGAAEMTLVESSKGAVAAAESNVELNRQAGQDAPVQVVNEDVGRFLRASKDSFDLIIVDPPPFAKRKGDVTKASRAYKDVILRALKHAAPGAQVLVFSCSHHVSGDLFRKIVFGAAIDAHCRLQVLRELGPPVDHPVSLQHPEGQYLTGLLLMVEERPGKGQGEGKGEGKV